MYKYVLFLVLSFSLLGCGGKKEEEIPAYVLSDEKMIKVLTEIYLIDAATNIHTFPGITMPADPVPGYDKFLKQHGITYAEFKKSYDWYIERPKKLNEIYTEVLNELSRKQAIHAKK